MEAINLFDRDFDREAEERRRRQELGEDRVFSLAEHTSELKAAVAAAREEAYEEGFSAGEVKKQGEIDQQVADALERLVPEVQKVVTDLPAHKAALEEQMIDLAHTTVSKIAPVFVEHFGADMITMMVRDRLARIAEPQSLIVRVSPEVVSDMETRLQELPVPEGAGSITVEGDEVLAGADLRVEWRNGFLEHRVSDLIEEVIEALRPTESGHTDTNTDEPEE